jgi:hypothetical protein
VAAHQPRKKPCLQSKQRSLVWQATNPRLTQQTSKNYVLKKSNVLHKRGSKEKSWRIKVKVLVVARRVVAVATKKSVSLKIGKHKSRSGGLTKEGREKYNRETGSNLKAPQPQGGPRKKSFCARMGGVKGPMKDSKGRPTRKALALRKWKC